MAAHLRANLPLILRIILVGATALSAAGGEVCLAGQSGSAAPAAAPTSCMAPVDFGIKSPSDIESAVIRFSTGDVYQLTFKDCPDTTAQLYRALLDLGQLQWHSTGGDDDMLILSGGATTATLLFHTDRETAPEWQFYANGTYHSALFDALLNSIRRDPKAATLGARIPLDPHTLEIAVPSKPLIRVELTSARGKTVVAKAKSIIDCLDVRGALTTRVDGDIEAAIRKFGAVILRLDEPVALSLYMLDTSPGRPECEGGYSPGIARKGFLCDEILVMSYGNLVPPAVILRDRWRNHYILGSEYLTRRAQEKRSVEKLGFPGHPVSDKDYYKSPQELYKELQPLAKAAYEAVAKEK